jgi:pimeloyl-ACP methyl ester carboxylesterase
MVLVNAAGVRVENAKMAELFVDDFDAVRALLFHNPHDEATVKQAMPTSLDDPRILMWLRAREATARVGWNPYLHNPRLPQHLHRIACPTLVLWGRQDKLIPLPHGEYLAAHIPGARLQVLENCGHMHPFEQPAEYAASVAKICGQKRYDCKNASLGATPVIQRASADDKNATAAATSCGEPMPSGWQASILAHVSGVK